MTNWFSLIEIMRYRPGRLFLPLLAIVSLAVVYGFEIGIASAQDISDTERCANPANPVIAENCLPGTTEWQVETIGNIEGFASKTSINRGEGLDFYVNTTAPKFDMMIYRSGYYGGTGGRLVQKIEDVDGKTQPGCLYEFATGLTSCGNWQSSYHLDIPTEWLSGIYVVKLIRKDNGGENYMLFVVRDDERNSDILYQQSVTTYQAYNYYGGKSLYSNADVWNACTTVTQRTRAAKVSFNRPYQAPMSEFNMYFHSEYPMVSWLEQQGYDVTYSTDLDTHYSGVPGNHNELTDHRIFLISGHDEYWTQEMFDAVAAARDAGVNIASFSSNTAYWRVRLETDPQSGLADRIMVGYKTSESGPADPSGHATSTFRDVKGVNNPENSLLGSMYVGDNLAFFYPIQVSAEEAQDPLYRNTGLQGIPPGSAVKLGQRLVGWEWDAVIDNGHTPDGLTVLATSPLVGKLIIDAGPNYTNVMATKQEVTRYTASSGAIVFNAGTNQWAWGLALVEPNSVIQQITYNLFSDMGVQPASPVETLRLDNSGDADAVPTTDDFYFPDQGESPVISNVSATVSETELTVSWDTNVATTGQMWFGTSPDTIQSWTDSPPTDLTTSHHIVRRFLKRATTYYYQVISTDENGNTVFSEIDTATTPAGSISERILDAIRPTAGSVVCGVQSNPILAIVISTAIVLIIVIVAWRLVRRIRLNRQPSHS